MPRWLRILIGPLAATILLLPFLLAGGLGTGMALAQELFGTGATMRERVFALTTTGMLIVWIGAAVVGVITLWIAVMEPPQTTADSPRRALIAAGLLIGIIAAGRWLWFMAVGSHSNDASAWAWWSVLLGGPLVMAAYYLTVLVLRSVRRSSVTQLDA